MWECKQHEIGPVRCKEPIPLKKFLNKKKLLVTNKAHKISYGELKNCFQNNPQLESLEFEGYFEQSFLKLLRMLPRLQRLQLPVHNGPPPLSI